MSDELERIIRGRDYQKIRVHIDVETFSLCDIKTAGAYLYAAHESTEFSMLGFRLIVDDQCFDGMWDAYFYDMPDILELILADPSIPIHAFNAGFERLILSRFFPQFPFPAERFHCTMAKAYALSFAGGLSAVGQQVGLPQDLAKSKVGEAIGASFWTCQVIKKTGLLKPRKMPEDHPEDWELFKDYCTQDVVAESSIDSYCDMLLEEPALEREFWLMNQRINDKGMPFDRELINAVLEFYQKERPKVVARIQTMVGIPNFNPGSPQQMRKYLNSKDCTFENMQAETVDAFLEQEHDLTDPNIAEVVQVLTLRRLISKGATMAKYAKADICTSRVVGDCYLRGGFVFKGASGTGRDAGLGFQPHNMARPTFDVDEVCEQVLDWSLEFFQPDPLLAVAGVVRGLVKAPDGQTLCVMDLEGIEDKTLPWIAGDEIRLAEQARGVDTYKTNADLFYNVGYERITKLQRTFGKMITLACQYGGGVESVHSSCKMYHVPALTNKDAKAKVKIWRDNNKVLRDYSHKLYQVFMDCVTDPGRRVYVGKLSVIFDKDFLQITLPSGRIMYYAHPHIMKSTKKFTDPETGEVTQPGFNCVKFMRFQKVWRGKESYYGLIIENVNQAVARDVLMAWALACEKQGVNIVGMVHDEIVSVHDVEDSQQVMDIMSSTLEKGFGWTEGLVLRCDGYINERYKK